MATLVYSDRCQYCSQVIRMIQENPGLLHIVKFHNVTTLGVPSRQITRVPTIVTNEGKILVGNEVKNWIESMANNDDFAPNEAFGPATTLLDGNDDDVTGNFFDFDNYGAELKPVMTRDLEDRINRKVQDAYSSYQNQK